MKKVTFADLIFVQQHGHLSSIHSLISSRTAPSLVLVDCVRVGKNDNKITLKNYYESKLRPSVIIGLHGDKIFNVFDDGIHSVSFVSGCTNSFL